MKTKVCFLVIFYFWDRSKIDKQISIVCVVIELCVCVCVQKYIQYMYFLCLGIREYMLYVYVCSYVLCAYDTVHIFIFMRTYMYVGVRMCVL